VISSALWFFDKLNLFLLSFLPLFLILAIMESNEKSSSKIIIFAEIILTCVPATVILLKSGLIYIKKRKHGNIDRKLGNLKLSHPQEVKDLILNYAMTYIVPLVTLSFPSEILKYTCLIILLTIIGTLYIRFDLVYLNPIIALFKNLYKAQETKKSSLAGKTIYVITSETFSQFKDHISDDNLYVIKISNSLYFLPSEKTK
jgi:hypothetical protein